MAKVTEPPPGSEQEEYNPFSDDKKKEGSPVSGKFLCVFLGVGSNYCRGEACGYCW